METIYFENQEGLLCAQHCLNALLQGQYFTPVDLAKIAKDLDEEEKQRMAESGVETEEYKKFIKQPSQNMDDSGYFSVQVISRCLSIWGLDLVRYGSLHERAQEAKSKPEQMGAYICNYKDHWFTVRKLGGQWFNLNSVSKGPTLISDTFLSLFLAQLEQEGYSIFVVTGEIPRCEADDALRMAPVTQGTTAPPSSPNHFNAIPHEDEVAMEAAEESEFQRALQLSLTARRDVARCEMDQDDDDDLKRAIALSLHSALNVPGGSRSGMSSTALSSSPDMCEGASGGCVEMCEGASGGFVDMDAELEAAVRLSLECSDSPRS